MDEYRERMKQLRDLLESCGDHHWYPRLDNLLDEYDRLQTEPRTRAQLIEYFQKVIRAVSGGMGSLSDLTLSVISGHTGDVKSLKEANQKMEGLLDQLYELCTAKIQHLEDAGGASLS